MDSPIEEIKNKLNILDVIGGYLKLTKTGINYRGVCPFHSEKKPSFFVNPNRQIWHCFGCGKGSSLFDFIMAIEGIEFGDALRILANKAGVELKKENPQLKTHRQRLYEICELACNFFEKQLEGKAISQEVKDYLLKRGINRDSIKKWRLGYSPDIWQGLSDFLVGQGYNREEVVEAGLAIEKDGRTGESYDRFRGRIMFPIFNLNGQVVGFGGRVFGHLDETAKYINTPQTILYDKSAILYGLHNAKLALRKQDQCVVTEGYTDVIMCHQAGFENTVAASGTALTSQHLSILKRYSDNLVLAFDMDIAGDSATKRGINTAESHGFNIKIIEAYLKDADPADIILKDPKMWEEAVAKARSIMDYYFSSAFASFNRDAPEGKRAIGKIILPAIKRLTNKIEQSYWIQKLSDMLGVKEEAVREELDKTKINSVFPESTDGQRGQILPEIYSFTGAFGENGESHRKNLIEGKVISLVLKNPDNVKLVEESHYPLFSEKSSQFLKEIKKQVENRSVIIDEALQDNFRQIFEKNSDEKFKNFLAALALKSDIDYAEDGPEELSLCLVHLRNMELKNKLNKISQDIKKAEAEKDSSKIDYLISQFNKLAKEL